MSNILERPEVIQIKKKQQQRQQPTSRFQKGCEICTSGKVFTITEGSKYFVQSQSNKDQLYNVAVTEDGDWTCSCPDFHNANLCKHCYSCITFEVSKGRTQEE